ncbi:MAG: hypothetical protein IK065_03455 [Neisseriaceae bacterium]|nr:hypothetical protein [Neisseriaceae bacterium]
MNNHLKVGGKWQRFFIGLILPTIFMSPFLLILLFSFPQELLMEKFLGTIVCVLVLVGISLIIEQLQKYNNFLFFLFSILVLLVYMFLTAFTIYLLAFFWSIVPSWLITIPILRWHYLHCKKKVDIQAA